MKKDFIVKFLIMLIPLLILQLVIKEKELGTLTTALIVAVVLIVSYLLSKFIIKHI